MSEYRAHIQWSRQPQESFVDARYSRAHIWTFDGGVVVPASSAVSSVPLPYSEPNNVDPEEAFVAAISSCHMLTFLYLAAKEGLVVDVYDDSVVGTMAKNFNGRLAVTKVQLAPCIRFSGSILTAQPAIDRLHHAAHEECFIANSVLSEIAIACTWSHATSNS